MGGTEAGWQHFAEADWAAARDSFAAVLEADPDDPEALDGLGLEDRRERVARGRPVGLGEVLPTGLRAAHACQRSRPPRGTRPPPAPRSVAGPRGAAIPSTRIAFRPSPSFSRPSVEPTSRPLRSRTRSSR